MPTDDQTSKGASVDLTPKTRELRDRVLAGLIIVRDADDDEDSWVLPDLTAVNHSIAALTALVQQANDRHRFKIALERIAKEWTEQDPDDIREFARSVIEGASARQPLAKATV